MEFPNTADGDFSGLYAAEKWLRDAGYSYGPTQADGPQAIFAGDCVVSKWRHLSSAERAQVDGTIDAIAGDRRNNGVVVTLRRVQQ